MEKRMRLGMVVATPGALALGVNLIPLIERHHGGDWGDIDPADRGTNDMALVTGERVISAYQTGRGCVWIVTEADRSSTCVLLPDEY